VAKGIPGGVVLPVKKFIAIYRYLTAQVFIRCKLIRIEVIYVPLLLIVVLFLRVLYFEF